MNNASKSNPGTKAKPKTKPKTTKVVAVPNAEKKETEANDAAKVTKTRAEAKARREAKAEAIVKEQFASTPPPLIVSFSVHAVLSHRY